MKWFYSLKIARRLMTLNVVAALALVAVSVFGALQSERVFTAASYSTDNTVPSLMVLDQALADFNALVLLTTRCVSADDAQKMQSLDDAIGKRRARLDASFAKYEPLVSDEKDRALLATDRALAAQADKMRSQVQALAHDGKRQEADALMGTGMADLATQMDRALEAHRTYNEELGRQGALHAQEILRTAKIWIAVAALAVVAAVLALASLIARSITRPLDRAIAFAHRVAEGDLTGRITESSSDETGHLLRVLDEMSGKLRQIVGRVRSGSETIATATSQIASGNLDLSSRTEQQASSLQQTAASMEELTSTVRQNADNAQQASTLATNASDTAERGSAVVGRVVQTMSEISDRSTKIADITGMIEGIAFQTNILALNAAVEAARAGEQGRGFAVVASEVRSLAQRSSNAAKEIKELIAASVQTVSDGSALAADAGQTMSEVTRAIARVTDIMGEIAAASSEQSRGIDQMGIAVTQMDETTQQNAALVEEAAAAAQALDEQGRDLAGAVAFFKVDSHV